jgi:AcrR family transcriptional regulator
VIALRSESIKHFRRTDRRGNLIGPLTTIPLLPLPLFPPYALTTAVGTRSFAVFALLYQFFRNREALMDAAINREIEELVKKQTELMKPIRGFINCVTEGIVVGIALARRDSILADLMNQSSIRHLPDVILNPSRPAHELVLGLWRPIFEQGRNSGELAAGISVHDLVEWILSDQYMFLLRDDITPQRQRELISLFVTPALLPVPPQRSAANTRK